MFIMPVVLIAFWTRGVSTRRGGANQAGTGTTENDISHTVCITTTVNGD